jgi:hypothetical protein
MEITYVCSIRFVGSKREVAIFENHRQIGPIVKVVPMSAGKGALMAVLEDPNYQVYCQLYHMPMSFVCICVIAFAES